MPRISFVRVLIGTNLALIQKTLQSTKLFNEDPFASWGSPSGAAPEAPAAPAAPAANGAGDSNQNVFGGKSLEWGGNDSDPNAKTVRLRDRLNEADTERRKVQEEAERRERAAEIAREERLKKIAYMQGMPDSTPAGTGESNEGIWNDSTESSMF